MMNENSDDAVVIPCHDVVNVVEFAPYEWCSNLLAVGTSSRVTVYCVSFEEETEHEDQDPIHFKEVKVFQCNCHISALSWSPETSYGIREVLDCIRLAVAGSDTNIEIITSDLQDKCTVQILKGHTDFVNSVTYSPEGGETLASTGDDLTCRLWDQEGDGLASIQLSAPGMSVCIHEKECRKVMVAQKNGVIKIFSLDLLQQIMSMDCGVVPLMAADWNRLDEDLIAVVAGTEWLIFQISRSSQPQERRQAHTEGARDIKWARSTPTLLCTTGRPGRQIKVFSTRHHQVPFSTSQLVAYGMSWHYQWPLLAVGGDKQVKLYPIEPAKAQIG